MYFDGIIPQNYHIHGAECTLCLNFDFDATLKPLVENPFRLRIQDWVGFIFRPDWGYRIMYTTVKIMF